MDTSRREFLKECAAASVTLLGASGCSLMPTFG
ncbi:MAG: twin-arginine translocation signal domain-containing protein, partial [Kiritimatiellae bacterium]|nr:twin-arginine translocation signal domain-containing protein [Kiritimatiellia bacterium]